MSAQLEDGYTRIANELLDNVMKQRFNGTQHSIIYCVLRNTYGFQRKSHEMSLTFISAATGIHKDLVKRELDKLIESKVIRVFKEAGFRSTREIGINKNTVDWIIQSEPKRRQSTNQSTVNELVAEQSTNQSTPTVDQLVYQERKSFKDIKDITTTATGAYLSVGDIHTKVFKTFSMSGLMSEYVMDLKSKGMDDDFIRELMLETGESGNNPNLRLMQTIGDRWIRDGVRSRAQAAADKEARKAGEQDAKHGGRPQGVRLGENQTSSSRHEGESKVYPGRWDDTPIQMPKLSG